MAQTAGERSDGGVYGSAVAAVGWQRGSAGRADLHPITDRMLDLAGIRPGHRVLDVAAGTGEQTLMAARRVGPDGFVLATDIADRMLAFLDEAARNEGLTNVQTRLVDARLLELERDSFDAAICRLALMLIPERHKALTAIHRALKAGARFAAIVLSTAEKEPHISESLAIARRHLGLRECSRWAIPLCFEALSSVPASATWRWKSCQAPNASPRLPRPWSTGGTRCPRCARFLSE